jgi:hypothetical protein
VALCRKFSESIEDLKRGFNFDFLIQGGSHPSLRRHLLRSQRLRACPKLSNDALDRLKVFLARGVGQVPLGLLDRAPNLFEGISPRIRDLGGDAFQTLFGRKLA